MATTFSATNSVTDSSAAGTAEDQGTGVVREPKGKDAEKWEAPRAPGQVAAGAGGGAGVSLLRLLY